VVRASFYCPGERRVKEIVLTRSGGLFARFVRTGRMLDDPELHSTSGARARLISLVLVLLVAGFSTYLVLG
jgi:hypothetical protein